MESAKFYDELRGFLLSIQPDDAGRAGLESLGHDDNLFDLGLVTSFSVIRMIVFIETLTGCSLDLAEHDIESFYTMRGLWELVRTEEAGTR
ncbi:hypothetical protein PV396_36735 [Streptomyces sp. ME02-8801-2C]|uniref:hypothetical protein n=1 Tax=Streptomyces sp. ME02-8801-2C TaxID=3028680 RepID=UPI0029B02E0D|nr:hypothetical protein [Streptomyces sp. ME02-8801-2C]MDX3457443.1 hypothetical protein [Streptomyces sp. ME02-8801-2C]